MASRPVVSISPSVLRWARETAGLDVTEVAIRLKREPREILAWEAGRSGPTYAQLEHLAYAIYKRPLALFFFPTPPSEPDAKASFRTLPDFEIDKLNADTRFVLRQAHAMILGLRDLAKGANPASTMIFREIRPDLRTSPQSLSLQVRSMLQIPLATQCTWRNTRSALEHWRDRVQDLGVFVFKHSLRQRSVSGFCLWDETFPVVYLNSSTSYSRQIFTLFHELAHILFRTGGVTLADDSFIDSLVDRDRGVEILCNRFAAEFLVPSDDFERLADWSRLDDEYIAEMATHYSVSREVILRRYLDRSLIGDHEYEGRTRAWSEQFTRHRRGSRGGDYYRTQVSYLGTHYLTLAFGNYYQGRITHGQLAEYLNVKAPSVSGIEAIFSRRSASR